MKRLETLVAFAEERLKPIFARSGRVLYSGAHTLRRGPMYLVGLNPGGDPTTHNDTVGSSLRVMLERTENAYLDESWTNCAIGGSPLTSSCAKNSKAQTNSRCGQDTALGNAQHSSHQKAFGCLGCHISAAAQ